MTSGRSWGDLELETHADLLAHLATSPLAEVRREPGLLAVATRVLSNTINGVVCSRIDPAGADAVIAELVAWFKSRRAPACWICREAVEPPDLRARLVAGGCVEERSGVQIGFELAALQLDDADVPAGVRIETVDSESGLERWLDVAERCDWVEGEEDRRARSELMLSLGLTPARPWVHYVASRGGRPVALASAFFGRRAVLLESLAVVDEERRRGIGTALVLARLLEARRRGCAFAVLGPSPDGAGLYRALGFAPSPTPPGRWFYLPFAQEQSS